MFKKKPAIKPLAPLRSSDRRKLADEIITEFRLEETNTSTAQGDDQADATIRRATLRKALCPDNLQSARFTTTQGPDLKTVHGTIYVGSHTSQTDQRTLWFRVEDHLCPTVYTLWHFGSILPELLTVEPVIAYLQNGANLMTPGLANTLPFPAKATTGSIVTISSTAHPDQAMVVGKCLIDVSALQQVVGVKGHAVEPLHCVGDELWSFSTSGKPGESAKSVIARRRADNSALTATMENVELDDGDDDGGVVLTPNDIRLSSNVPTMSTAEIDTAFRNAFVYAMYQQKENNDDTPQHGLDLPLSQSATMTLLQPYLTAPTPEQTAQLQIKNSSHKSIKKFIKFLDKAHMVKSKDRDKHETVIIDVDFDDDAFTSFVPYALNKTREARQGETTNQVNESDDPCIGQKIQIQQFYKPPSWLPEALSYSATDESLTAADLRQKVDAYISTNSLSMGNKRIVKLDGSLAKIFDGTRPLDAAVCNNGSVSRDALNDRLMSACLAQYSISIKRSTDTTDTSTIRSGQPPRVQVTMMTRSGNKTATKISGLEPFNILVQQLADELRKTCASSTSVDQLVGSSPRAPIMEIMVQGPQSVAVLKALAKRGVDSKWVNVVNKSKKKG